jgi:lincosamide and streptogramin A transport system ATP-binding/permease protein
MKRSITAQNRRDKEIEEKSKLLQNIESTEDLKMNILDNRKGKLIDAEKLSIYYDSKKVFDNISFSLEDGDRIWLKGKNGCGKSSIIKLLLGEDIKYEGSLHMNNDLKISYISQDTSFLKGKIKDFIINNGLDETIFRVVLSKLDFNKELFDRNIESYSEGQKKKILIAKSLSEKANIYIWDEPLNYIDIFSRIQIENLILSYNPTMIFVEHDETFSNNIATKEVKLDRQ